MYWYDSEHLAHIVHGGFQKELFNTPAKANNVLYLDHPIEAKFQYFKLFCIIKS